LFEGEPIVVTLRAVFNSNALFRRTHRFVQRRVRRKGLAQAVASTRLLRARRLFMGDLRHAWRSAFRNQLSAFSRNEKEPASQ
jgi:hypothetical protein